MCLDAMRSLVVSCRTVPDCPKKTLAVPVPAVAFLCSTKGEQDGTNNTGQLIKTPGHEAGFIRLHPPQDDSEHTPILQAWHAKREHGAALQTPVEAGFNGFPLAATRTTESGLSA